MNALTPVGTPRRPAAAATPLSRAGEAAPAPELRELRSFVAAARTGNLGRAAQAQNISAAAISQQLRKLEATLGTSLLVRHSRGVIPTPAGQRLLERAETILRLLDAALEPAGFAAVGEAAVTLVLPSELGPLVAAPLATLLRQRWPDLTPELRDSAEGPLETLCGGQADIALLPDPPELDTLHMVPVASERLGLVIAPRDALADSGAPLRLRDLLGVPLLLPARRHWICRRLTKAAFQRGLRFDAVTRVDGVPLIRAMVRDGLGCAVLPAAAVREDLARGALVFRPLEQSVLTVSYAVAASKAAPPMVHELASAMAATIRAIAASEAWPGAQPSRMPAPPAEPETAPDGLAPPPAASRPATALALARQTDPQVVASDIPCLQSWI